MYNNLQAQMQVSFTRSTQMQVMQDSDSVEVILQDGRQSASLACVHTDACDM